ncbi:MAG: C40 family peptidase [Nocardioides sp.]|nr:C40 family peptidase [Nocardioides sp.]
MPTSVLPALPIARGRSILMVFAIVAALIFSSGSFAAPAAEANTDKLKKAVKITANQKGDPYNYGSAGPDRFDCSGLTYFAFKRAGFRNIPRTSRQQANFAKRIPRKQMKRGDFVFFHNNGSVYHMGVYGGRNKKTGKRFIIHAPYGGKRVHRAPIWANNWFAGTVRHRL